MHRREFFHPRRVARTLGQVLAPFAPEGPPPAPPADVALVRAGRQAMATTFELFLPFDVPQAHDIACAALDEIDRLEEQLTVYRDTSEVSGINRRAAAEPVVVEARLFQLLELSARLTTETLGAFDITAGALIKAWGFFRGPRRVPSEAELADALDRVGMRHVRLDPERRTAFFDKPGLEINLGSIGKGYALDRVAETLRDVWGVRSALLHGGRSSVLGVGSPAGDDRGWLVGVRHPWEPERRLALVRLSDRALGTSAATFQHLEYDGKKLGHILDPRTGWPADALASASAVAPSAAEADALATAFFILGVDKARAWCERHPHVGAVLLPPGEDARPVVLNLTPGPPDGALVPHFETPTP